MEAGPFSPRTEALLDRAGAICESRGARLTDLRRQVLGLILDNEAPTGAYHLLDRLRTTRHSAAPPTVYRALDFLLDQGLVHRVERLSAFVGCVAPEDETEGGHAAQFLICSHCRRVTEMEDEAVSAAMKAAAARLGFTLNKATIEAEGLCAECRRSASTTLADPHPA
jgi:Fur family zinc uptake transcriptional regulator